LVMHMMQSRDHHMFSRHAVLDMHALLFGGVIFGNAPYLTRFVAVLYRYRSLIHNDHWHDGDIDENLHVSFQLASSMADHRTKYGLRYRIAFFSIYLDRGCRLRNRLES